MWCMQLCLGVCSLSTIMNDALICANKTATFMQLGTRFFLHELEVAGTIEYLNHAIFRTSYQVHEDTFLPLV